MIIARFISATAAILLFVQVGAEEDLPPPHTLSPIRPRSTLHPIKPRAVAGPECSRPLPRVTVPPGGSVTISSPTAPQREERASTVLCGWAFKTEVGETLSITCSPFSLRGKDKLVVTQRGDNRKIFRYSNSDGPTNKNLASHMVNVAFRYNPAGDKGSFTCEVSATGGNGNAPTATTSTTTSTSSVTDCRCGIVNRASRIVGGSNTDVNEYPWQVGLITTYSKDVFCGATLVSDRHVLTAAHCTDELTTSNFRLLLGGHSTASQASSELIVRPIKITDQPNYSDVTYDSDMSIIEIDPLEFPDFTGIRPICLPDSDDTYAGATATVTGWGTLESDGSQPTILQEVNVPVVSTAACRQVYGTSAITDKMLCAGTAAGGKDSCQGDSGGPLIAPDGANYELIGVVSFGAGCGDPGVPGVYARVTALQSWITATTAGSETCGR